MSEYSPSLDNTWLKLYDFAYRFFNPHFKPRRVFRHLAISKIFGNELFWKISNSYPKVPESWDEISRLPSEHNEKYFHSSDYYYDRMIVEILISATNNHGRIAPYILMDGKVGKFYEQYYDARLKELSGSINVKHKRTDLDKIDTFGAILKKLRLDTLRKYGKFDKLTFLPVSPGQKNDDDDDIIDNIDGIISAIVKEFMTDKTLFSKQLSTFFEFTRSSEFPSSDSYSQTFTEVIKRVFFSDNTKIQSKLRNTRYHIFERYDITDSLSSELSSDINFYLALTEGEINTIFSCVDYGSSILKFLPLLPKKGPHSRLKDVRIYLILQEMVEGGSYDRNRRIFLRNAQRTNHEFFFDQYGQEKEDAKNWFNRNVKCLFLPIDEHVHHLNMYLKLPIEFRPLKTPPNVSLPTNPDHIDRAIYYYKFGLNSSIDPVRLVEESNKGFALSKFIETVDIALRKPTNKKVYGEWKWIVGNVKPITNKQ